MRKTNYSLIKVLKRIYMSITLFLLAILITYNFYCLHTVKQQYTDAQQQSLDLYIHEIDNSLSKISSLLMSYQLQNIFPSLSDLDTQELFSAKKSITSQLSTALLFLNYCDGLFLYDYNNNEYCYAFSSTAERSQTYTTRITIPETVSQIIRNSNKPSNSQWTVVTIENYDYLLYLQWDDGVCTGSWIQAGSLLPGSSDSPFRPEIILNICDHQGTPLNTDKNVLMASSSEKKYIQLSQSFNIAPVTIVLYAPAASYLSTLNLGLGILLCVSVFALLTIPAVYTLIKRMLKQPLEQVLYSISQYESGHSDYTPCDEHMPCEIIHINHALTNMYHEIQTLKIDIYEKQLQLKDTHLQYLQHQIKPHFVINILNTLSLMAQMNDTQSIISVIGYLSNYLRNMLNTTIKTASIKSEIEQLNNYIKLQEMRYPEQIHVTCMIEPILGDFQIPVLTIQTLVENIFKHAMESYAELYISISASEKSDFVEIIVKDNGCGFPEDLIHHFNTHPEDTGDGQHIGLVNIRQRLNLEYPGQADMTLKNDSGAVVIIHLPK